MSRYIWLSYPLDEHTPSYGNRDVFNTTKTASISRGDSANHTRIEMSCHLGTHIDMPFHFYENGQTIEDFPADFWVFKMIGFLEIEPKSLVIKEELIERLDELDSNVEILLVKTGACYFRSKERYGMENYGFHPDLAEELRSRFQKLRVFGFDTISVSSFADRPLGRQAHRGFLNPERPILLLEDMDLYELGASCIPLQVFLAPLAIRNADGLPCSVIGHIL